MKSVDIGWLKAFVEKNSLFGGSRYDAQLIAFLEKYYNVEDIFPKKLPNNIVLNRISQLYKLARISSKKDLFIRGIYSTITLDIDRTEGKNLLLFYHLDPSATRSPMFNNILNKFFYRNLRLLDEIVVISKYWKGHFNKLGFKNIDIAYCGFDLKNYDISDGEVEEFKEENGLGDKPIIYMGNCQKNKGVVEIYNQLKNRDFTLVTSGKRKVNLPARNFELSYRDYLKLLKSADIVIGMDKFNTGWSITLHEAMLLKRPVIGSNMGALPELLSGGGQIICNDFKDLNKLVDKALEKSKKMSSTGYKYAKRFTIKRFEKTWKEIIENTLGK